MAASSSASRLRLPARCPSCSSELSLSPSCTRRLFSSAASRRGPAASTSPPASSSSSSSAPTTTQTFHTRNGRVRIDLAKPSLVGVHQSRGERAYQEDTYAVRAVLLDGDEAARSVAELDGSPSPPSASPSPSASSSSPGQRENGPASGAGSETATAPETEQAVYVGVFDGHNGTYVSAFLRERLHELVVGYGMHERGRIQRTVDAYRALGGYLRRYRPPALRGVIEDPVPRSRLAQLRQERDRSAKEKEKEKEKADGKERSVGQEGGKGAAAERQAKDKDKEKDKEGHGGSDVDKSGSSTGNSPAVVSGSSHQGGNSGSASASASGSGSETTRQYTLQQRITASFLEADLDIIGVDKEAGAVATVALVHSLDEPRNPFFSSEALHLLVAHLGDTRALLCTAPGGEALVLTERHHPEARTETDRLMRTRTGAVTDSFGESRWAGTLANTRGFGDAHYKQLGVFAEPAITSRILSPASSYAFLILLSDGVTDMISDQEICDLCRGHRDPSRAAKAVVSFAESIGGQDNLTAVVLPLPGWGGVTSEDSTLKRRTFRQENYEGRSSRQERM